MVLTIAHQDWSGPAAGCNISQHLGGWKTHILHKYEMFRQNNDNLKPQMLLHTHSNHLKDTPRPQKTIKACLNNLAFFHTMQALI